MDEIKQKRLDLLKDEYNRISKELFEMEEKGIILDSGSIVPSGGYKYRNELEEKRFEIFQEMQRPNDGEKL